MSICGLFCGMYLRLKARPWFYCHRECPKKTTCATLHLVLSAQYCVSPRPLRRVLGEETWFKTVPKPHNKDRPCLFFFAL